VDVSEYLLPSDAFDWGAVLERWAHLLPDEVVVWLVNRFGEAFLVGPDGSVLRLSPERGEPERLAPDREAFLRAIDRPENARAWLRLSDVDAAVRAGHVLGAGQCYGWKVPLLFAEGTRSLENLRVWDLPVYWAVLADVHRGTEGLPDGARVRLRPR
jgi:hypothetical protein